MKYKNIFGLHLVDYEAASVSLLTAEFAKRVNIEVYIGSLPNSSFTTSTVDALVPYFCCP